MEGMTVDEMLPYLVEIPKPNGGKRILGVPTVIDRMIQQAIVQVLQPIDKKIFSDKSYGFRPNCNAQQAIKRAKEYYEQGYFDHSNN